MCNVIIVISLLTIDTLHCRTANDKSVRYTSEDTPCYNYGMIILIIIS